MKFLKSRKMIIFLSTAAILTVVVLLFMGHPKFGQLPSESDLQHIMKSPNYRGHGFSNRTIKVQAIDNQSNTTKIKQMLSKDRNAKPRNRIPSVREELKRISLDKNVLVWLGHSSVYMQIEGKRIMIDPVLSSHASPLPFLIRAFEGTTPYSAEDFPPIDFLFITHDHWDHLDYNTIKHLDIKQIICPLGVGAHLRRWGMADKIAIEGDWNDSISLGGMNIYFTPSQHFSGRTFTHNQSLWSSYVIETPNRRLYVSGDGGYGTHFAEIGAHFGNFDLAILECGQYNTLWDHIHMFPEQTLRAAEDLHARELLPVHNSRFALAKHAWYEPLMKITALRNLHKIKIMTPIIGSVIDLDDSTTRYTSWWEAVK